MFFNVLLNYSEKRYLQSVRPCREFLTKQYVDSVGSWKYRICPCFELVFEIWVGLAGLWL